MHYEYAVTALNLTTDKILVDVFYATDEEDARHCFKECYRHDKYKILSTVQTGRM